MTTFAKAVTIEEAVRGLNLTAPTGVSAGLVDKIADHNESASKVLRSVEESEAAVRSAVENIVTEEGVGSLSGSIENRRFLEVECAQVAAQIWHQRGELAEKVLDEARAKIEPADTKLAAAVEATRAGLESLGICEASMIAGGWNAEGVRNPTAAAAQLRHIVAQALPVREAQRTAHDAKNATSAAVQQIAASESGMARATSAAKSLAEKCVGILA